MGYRYETKDGVKIIGVVEDVLVTTPLIGNFLEVDEDGEHGEPTVDEALDIRESALALPEYRTIHWDTCRTVGEVGRRVFAGEDGADYDEQDLVLVKSED